jgi:hypothetical protein
MKVVQKQSISEMNTLNKFFLPALLLLFAFNSCDEPASCPDGNLCIQGNELTYQLSSQSAVITIINPEGAIHTNAAVDIIDMVPGYPAQVDYNSVNLHFGGAMFNIEPDDLTFSKFLTIKIKFPAIATTDYLGNQWAEDFRMYYIKDGNWSVVNESYYDAAGGTVNAQVLRLGVYAVGAKKECIEGDWIVPSTDFSFGYSSRIVFLHNETGYREWVVDCDTAANVTDYKLAKDFFIWKTKAGGLVDLTEFTEPVVCGGLATPQPDLIDMLYFCSDGELTMDFGTYQRKD